jgi:hypothetical protein
MILFYGNCQTSAILGIMKDIFKKVKVKHIPCYLVDIEEDEFLSIILQSTIIITQPIQDNYRDKPFLSTSFIVKNARKESKIIIFPSCWFEFYHFDLSYQWVHGEILKLPIDYHYLSIIDCYRHQKSFDDYYQEWYLKEDYDSIHSNLLEKAKTSLLELKKREKNAIESYNIHKVNYDHVSFITISDFIEENYRRHLLFYSINHPTKYLLQYIAQQICDSLPISSKRMNRNIDPLNNFQGILYPYLQKYCFFDVLQHSPRIFVPPSTNLTNIEQIFNYYIDSYKSQNITF